MKFNWKVELPLIAVIVGMWVAAAMIWPTAPEQLPAHWGMDGEVDRYGGRTETLLAFPLMAVAIYLVMLFAPRLDPGRLNYPRFAGAYTTIRTSAVALMALFYVTVLLSARGVPVDMPRFVGLAVGAALFVMGNVLGKLRPNWFFGIRTPWTLSSKRSWTQTNRLAGWVFVAGGMVLMAAGLIAKPVAMVIAVGILAVGTLASIFYSYWIWRSDPDRVPPAGTLPANGDRL